MLLNKIKVFVNNSPITIGDDFISEFPVINRHKPIIVRGDSFSYWEITNKGYFFKSSKLTDKQLEILQKTL